MKTPTSHLTPSRKKRRRPSRRRVVRPDMRRVDAMDDHWYRLDMMAELLQTCGTPIEPELVERVGIWLSQELEALKSLLDETLQS